jgi:prepilin-type N-terminal cleavage/methylation domain-containing protein
MVRIVKTKGSSGFTLVEIMIAVAIVGVLASMAIPSFQKYIFDAKESEGVQLLMSTYRDELRVKEETGSFSQYFTGAKSPSNVHFVGAPNGRFNVIIGSTDAAPPAGAKWSYDQLGYNVNPATNKFGVVLNPVTGAYDRLIIGAEADLLGDGSLHVLAIDENGNLFRICDQWSKQTESTRYNHTYGLSPNCKFGGGGVEGGSSD